MMALADRTEAMLTKEKFTSDKHTPIVYPQRMESLKELATSDKIAFREGLRSLIEETALALDFVGFSLIKNYFGSYLIRESPLFVDTLNLNL